MSKETKYIGFCSSKGGVGKTSISILVASCMHYVKGLTIAIVDCDYPIRTALQVREREIAVVDQSRELQRLMVEQFQKTGQKIYPIIPSSPAEGFSDLQAFLKHDEREFDIIIFDLPGTTNTAGVLSTMACLDHVFVPVSPCPLVMESTLLLINILTESIIGRNDHALKEAHLFWTKIDKRENPLVFDRYNRVMEQFGLSRMETCIPDRKRVSKEISSDDETPYRSTLFAPDRRFLRECNIIELADEILTILNIV